MSSAMNVMPTTGVVAILVALGLSVATFYRRRRPAEPRTLRPSPARALSAGEREDVLALLHAPRFVDKSPAEVLATLLEEGHFPCSERTMYRILEANSEVRERRDQLRHPAYTKPELIAVRPSQVWTWDITKLRTHVKFEYLYLYVIIDIYSRYIVGWLLADRESAQLAERLVKETCEKHGVTPDYLHADRGSAMKSKLLSQLLAQLDIERSHSRPHREPVQDPQVPPQLPREVRRSRRRPRLLPRVLPLVQRAPSPRRTRLPHATPGALRPGRGGPSPAP